MDRVKCANATESENSFYLECEKVPPLCGYQYYCIETENYKNTDSCTNCRYYEEVNKCDG